LGEMLLPPSTVGYDVMVYTGLQRYLHHQQRDEIRAALPCQRILHRLPDRNLRFAAFQGSPRRHI